MPKFILKITAESAENCIDEKNVECFILSASLPEDCLGRIIRKIEAAGKIALLEGEDAAALAVKLGADGIVADLSASTAIKKEMAALRRQLGRRFLGVICRSRRHEAKTNRTLLFSASGVRGRRKPKRWPTGMRSFFCCRRRSSRWTVPSIFPPGPRTW